MEMLDLRGTIITTDALNTQKAVAKKAINLDGIAGTDYFTGTAANPIYSATVATTVITLTDRIPCLRQVAQTITKADYYYGICPGPGDPKTRRNRRKLTLAEVRLLGSFPPEYRLPGTFNQVWARIGNCVPPMFMHSISAHVRRSVLEVA